MNRDVEALPEAGLSSGVSPGREPVSEYDAYIRRYAVWNFVVNVADNAFFVLSLSFVFSTTVLPLYAGYLPSSAVLIGLITAIQQVGMYLPQLILARWGESQSRTKPAILVFALFQRLPYLVIAGTILLLPDAPKPFSLSILIICIAVSKLSAGAVMPMYKKMLGKLISPERRGIFFGSIEAVGALLGIGGAVIARALLNRLEFPVSYGICFGAAFLLQMVSYLFLCLLKEPEDPVRYEPVTRKLYGRELLRILREHTNFTRYLVSQSLVTFGAMAAGFYILYARDSFGVSDEFAGSMTITAMIGQSTGTLIFGWLADRLGRKWLAQAAVVMGIAGTALLLSVRVEMVLYGVFVLVNLSRVCLGISRNAITMEFCPIERLPTYSALSSTILGLPMLLAPLFAGWVVDVFGYRPMFASALGFSVVGFIVLTAAVVDPGKRT